jgi:uncharacterized SAM-binding protein YcdF (DUF218 family)
MPGRLMLRHDAAPAGRAAPVTPACAESPNATIRRGRRAGPGVVPSGTMRGARTGRATAAVLNSLLVLLGIEAWKPVLTALILPPLPLLLLVLVGARLMLPRRGLGWFVIVVSVGLLWLSACVGTAQVLTQFALHPPAAITASRIAELKAEVRARRPIAIIVLGGGVETLAPEYGVSSLAANSLERLRYGLWLSRETGAPVAFSGGIGWAQAGSATPEAQVAARIAAQEFGRPIKWLEDQSRDTRENAARSIGLMKQAGIEQVLLVTHGWHMPRSRRAFDEAAAGALRIEVAPMGLAGRTPVSALNWLPTADGATRVHNVLRELLGLALGA